MAQGSYVKSGLQTCLGFLTVTECPKDGLFGGYLAVDFRGRPLEFRCTAPIKPNRAQQILYGPTLNAYLYGEQIGQTLLKDASARATVVCTDHVDILAVRDLVDMPVVLVETPAERAHCTTQSEDEAETKQWRVDATHAKLPSLAHFQLGQNQLAVSTRAEDDQQTILERLASLDDGFDLAEPFQRIREAIDEARRGGGC